MNPVSKQILIPALSAIAGGLIVVGAMRVIPAKNSELDRSTQSQKNEAIYDDIWNRQNGIQDGFDSIFNDDFFDHSDPFKEIKDHVISNPFDTWFSDKFGGGSINDIFQREDDKFVYYDVKVADLNSTSINTKVENGYITITGSVEKKATPGRGESYYKSTFNRMFPLPVNVDAAKMEMSSEKDKVVLRFPKLTS